jgi:hypothetical protein
MNEDEGTSGVKQRPQTETFEKCPISFEFKEGESRHGGRA